MEDRVMPLIFFNLSGEMLYIIRQRLQAQNIVAEKSARVVEDIIRTMMGGAFLAELFKPQKMYTRLAMKSVFEKLVHSSIMRLNDESMTKLYDLMLMVFKYQLVNCKHPKDLLLVTLNHLDEIRLCSEPYVDVWFKVKNLHLIMMTNYKDLKFEEYECLYKCIEQFLQGMELRVSILIRLGLQLPTGEFIKHRYKGSFSEGCKSDLDDSRYKYEGKRNFLLGTNVYLMSYNTQLSGVPFSISLPPVSGETADEKDYFQGIGEINLLSRMIGNYVPVGIVPEVFLALFDEDIKKEEDEKSDVPETKSTIINICASDVKNRKDLEKIKEELKVEEEEDKKKPDILELMDTAETYTVVQKAPQCYAIDGPSQK